MSEPASAEYFAGLLCGILLVVVAAAVVAIAPDPAFLRATFTPEHIDLLGMYDSRGQQWAHRILMMLLGGMAVGLWAARPISLPAHPPKFAVRAWWLFAQYGGFLVAAYVLAVASFSGRRIFSSYFDFQGTYPLGGFYPSLANELAFAVFGVLATYFHFRAAKEKGPPRDSVRKLVLAAFVSYVLMFIALGILRRPDFSGFSPGLLAGVEWHYSGSVGSADRIGLGERLGDVPLHSGLLPSVLLGAWQKASGMLGFGGHIRLIAVLQAALLLAAVIGYGIWYSWRATPWIAASLLVLPWAQPLHAAVLYPNQSAWRFLGLCAGTVLLVLLHQRSLRIVAPILGFAGGAALLWNAETGVCLCIAYFVFLILRSSAGSPLSSMAAPALGFLSGSVCAAVVFALIVRIGLGYWPDPVAIGRSFPLIGDFSKGYGGQPFKIIEPLTLLVFVHALYVLIRGLITWGSGSVLQPREASGIAISALLVFWAAYYFKGPHPWNLWSFLFIYGFLLGDLLRAPASAEDRGIRAMAKLPQFVALSLIIVPAIIASNAAAARSVVVVARQANCPGGTVLSGACVPADLGKMLREKATALQESRARAPLLYFTADTYFMPLMTGVWQSLRQRDPFSDSILLSDFDRLVADVAAIRPGCILFDDPASPLSGYEPHRAFYKRLLTATVSQYEWSGNDRGWAIWCLKSR